MADVWSLLERALKNVQFFCHEVYVCLAYIKFVSIPATSFVDDFRHLRAVEAILVREVGFDAAFVLKYNLKIDTREEFIYTGFQTFSDLIAVKT